MVSAFLLILCLIPAASPAAETAKTDFPVVGGVVRSEKWIIRKEKGEEEFSGNVSYKNADYSFKSDWALFKKAEGELLLKGHASGVRLWPDGSKTEAFGGYARCLNEAQTAFLEPARGGQVLITHDDPKYGIWRATADKAFFDGKKNRLDLEGNARIEGENLVSLSEKAVYLHDARSLELFGRPVITGTRNNCDFAVSGDTATVTNSYNLLSAQGSVKGWVRKTQSNGTKLNKS